MPKILFIAAHRPGRSPSQRFRFEQYLEYFKEHGFDYDISWLISEEEDKIFYRSGNILTKIGVIIRSIRQRFRDVRRASSYDIVFVQREAFMTGSCFFEKKFSKSGAKLIFDFDDALWLLDISEANKKFEWLKNPGKTARIISIAHLVIAGNHYLADYASGFNKKVVIIPTTIDTFHHKREVLKNKNGPVCVGWTGSITTIKHFEYAVPFLLKLKDKYGEKISFKVIGDETYRNEALGIKGLAWISATEIADLSEIDIGIMPLPNDEWAKGKCGLKGLSYMAMKIPTVMSPVGVNSEIIQEGLNGFLASGTEEWVQKISLLVESTDLRERMGEQARITVEQKYSVQSQKEKYLQCFKELIG